MRVNILEKKSDVYFVIKDVPEMDTYWDMNAHILERKQYDLCVAKAEDWINAFSQSIHWNGFPSSMTKLMCC